MSIFDIFKKKKQSTQPQPVEAKPKAVETYDPAKEYETKLENALLKNPEARKYRVNIQQTELTMNDITLGEFYLCMDQGYTVIDFETTGLSPATDMIIEVGAVRVRNGEIDDIYHQYVNPSCHISEYASNVNHITDDMVANSPFIYEILGDLLTFIGSDLVVAHNAAFDLKFLMKACMIHKFKCPGRYFDSMLLSELYPEAQNKKQKTLLAAAGIENAKEHQADGDATALANLIIASRERLRDWACYNCTPNYSNLHCTEKIEPIDQVLAGKRFCVTGQIDGYERYDFEKLILQHAGKATLKISNATDYLIVGTYTGMPYDYYTPKEAYAKKLISEGGKIKIITPEEFFGMLSV